MSNSDLTTHDIKHIAKLINLPIDEKEAKSLAPQLTEAANYVEVLEELDLDGVEETSQVTGLVNISRKDEITPSFTQEQALSGAKNTQDGYFVVPAVIKKK